MKLKFRAEPKDFAIFGIFCLVLLYFISIAVLNLSSFAQDGSLHGFNPFPAFGPKYIIATLVFFLVALIAIVMSVSSYFFDREKGVGVSVSPKKEKGYSRWAEAKEMKQELKVVHPNDEVAVAAGIPLINDGKEIWVDNGEYHNLIIGSTGSGKTQITVLPMVKLLAKKGESMIVTDPKGEIYEGTANMLREKGYNIVLLNFRDPQKGNAWNPLALPYSLHQNGNKDKANELLDDLAMNILYDEKAQNQDPFWEKTSADYFAGLALGLFDDAKEEEINLNSINLMTTMGEEKLANTTYIKEYFSGKDPSSPAYINVSSTLMAPSETKSSILSVFKQKIKLFSSRENLSEMLSHSDFDIKDIGRKKTAVFIVIQDEKKTYHSLVTIFIKQCYETLIDVAQENGGKLAFKTNFILDEFANMPPLKDVTTMVTAARSRNIRFSFIIQNFAQLYQVYGKENGETIKGNCGNIVYLISSEIAALEEISKMCGEVKSKEKDKTASTPLVTVSDLQRMKPGEIIVLRTRMMPFKTKMFYDWKMDWGRVYEKAPYPERERQAVSLFDIKKFVDKIKEEKMNQMLSEFGKQPNGGMMPNMNPGMFGPNPMGPGMFGGMPNPMMGMPNMANPSIPNPMSPNGTQGVGINPGLPMGGTNNGLPSFGPNINPNQPNGFNVDDLVKRIDAKIAELEEEERLEREKEVKTKGNIAETTVSEPLVSAPIESPISINDFAKAMNQTPKETPVVLESVPVVNEPIADLSTSVEQTLPKEEIMPELIPNIEETKKIVEESTASVLVNPVVEKKKGDITDDQFFDDFFFDDEK